MTMLNYKDIRMHDIYFKLCLNNRHLDEQKVSWDDNICKLIHKKCH